MAAIQNLPISIKGVVFVGDKVLLAKNERNEWELLGGRIELGEDPRDTVCREVREESGLVVEVAESPIDSYVYDVSDPHGKQVFIVTYGCLPVVSSANITLSAEHAELGLFSVDEALDLEDLPSGYVSSISRWAARLESNVAK